MEGQPVAMIDARDPNRILQSHPNLLEQLPAGAVRLTLDGRLFVIHQLLAEKILTKEKFSEVTRNNADGMKVFLETGKMLADLARAWIAKHDLDLKSERSQEIIVGTDLSYQSVGVLMWVMAQSNRNFESSQGR